MHVDLEALQAAYKKVATLVIEDSVYVPIFERVAHEIAVYEKQNDVIERAKAVLASYKAAA